MMIFVALASNAVFGRFAPAANKRIHETDSDQPMVNSNPIQETGISDGQRADLDCGRRATDI
jgi:hypothetical protein